MLIAPKGSPDAPVWVIVDKPLANDIDKRYLFSSGLGYVWDKMMRDAGLDNYFVISRKPDTEDQMTGGSWESDLQYYKPKFILALDAAGKWLLPELEKKQRGKAAKTQWGVEDSEISKYAGSLLTSDKLAWPHYIVPTFGPQEVVKQWKLRDIVVSCDLQKIAAELQYFEQHKKLQELPKIEAKVDFDSFDELIYTLEQMMDAEWLSNDIETIYPKAPTKTQPSQFYKILPGYPITIGLADSIERGISFDLFRESTKETRQLWQKLAILLKKVRSVGQNFFNFDANFYEMLGFILPLAECRDTMILHHILWPELPHKLQFLARQYTRMPYWKDEGAGWSTKDMRNMKIYNVKDCCGTLDIFHKEMIEIKERGLD